MVSYDYMLSPPEDPPWCEEHDCALETDADEDGLYSFCPECEREASTPKFSYPCARGCGRTIGTWVPREEPLFCLTAEKCFPR